MAGVISINMAVEIPAISSLTELRLNIASLPSMSRAYYRLALRELKPSG